LCPLDAAEELHGSERSYEGALKLYDAWADKYDESLNEWGYEAPQRCAELLRKYLLPLMEKEEEEEVQGGKENTEFPRNVFFPSTAAAAGTTAGGASRSSGSEDSPEVWIHDCGCGTGMSGEALRSIAGVSCNIVGSDCSKESLSKCMKKEITRGAGAEKKSFSVYNRAAEVNLDKPCGPGPENGGFGDECFVAVTCVGVTSYISDFKVLFGDWARTLVKHGIFVCTINSKIYDENQNGVKDALDELLEGGNEDSKSRQGEGDLDCNAPLLRLLYKSEQMPYMPRNTCPEEASKKIYYLVLQKF